MPSDEEWKKLEINLGMSKDDANMEGWRGSVGYKMKNTYGWLKNENGSNKSGMSILPAGFRKDDLTFKNKSYHSLFLDKYIKRFSKCLSQVFSSRKNFNTPTTFS